MYTYGLIFLVTLYTHAQYNSESEILKGHMPKYLQWLNQWKDYG